MKRASLIAIVPVVVLLAVWSIPGASAQEAPASTPPAAAAAAETPEMPEITEAKTLFRQRDADGALKSLKAAYKKDPTLPPPHVLLAQLFAANNLVTGMRNALEQGVKEYPNDPQAYAILAELAMRDRRITEARLLYEKAESLLPKMTAAKRQKEMHPQILAGLAMTSEARDDWAGAQQKIEAWLLLDAKSIQALEELAQCMLQQKNEDGAMAALVKATKLADDQLAKDNAGLKAGEEKKTDTGLLSPEATLAKFYARAGDQEKAQKWMTQALNLRRSDIKIRLLAAQWLWETGKLTQAQKQAEAALQIDGNSLDALLLRGVIALFQKNYKTAEQSFEKAQLLKPNTFPVTNNLALALIEQNSDEKKQRAYDYAQGNADKYAKTQQAGEAYSTFGWVLYKLEKYDDAEKCLRAATSSGAYTSDTAYYYARVLAKKGGQNKLAIALLENALKFNGAFANREDAKSLLDQLKK